MRVERIEKVIEDLKFAKQYAEPWKTAIEKLKLREAHISELYAHYYHSVKQEGNEEPLSIIKWLEKRKQQQLD
tara:strand:- start:314 stop:532 length:219 start_codon:yes stop_codon:yes gene_type:complete